MFVEKCFNCGKPKKQEVCEHCGYVFSFLNELDKCPRRIMGGNLCSENRKLCPYRKDWEKCPKLND